MLLQMTLRTRASTWRWPWRQVARLQPCERLLQLLPLRMLRQPASDAPLLEWLLALCEQMGANHACLLLPVAGQAQRRCLGGEPGGDCLTHVEGPGLSPGSLQVCGICLQAGHFRLLCGLPGDCGQAALQVEFPRLPARATCQALGMLACQLGEVLAAFAEDRQQRRRELAAERGVLARELHDSVAQQLSYLQIRACRLEAALGEAGEASAARAMLGDLRQTLQLLHRQVRELISTARLTMDGRSLRQALEASVEEFSRRSSCVFTLDNRLSAEQIAAEAELQVLQIVREALANVVRHSHARQVQVALLAHADGTVEVSVEDDGVGLPVELEQEGHFGLRIMQERAAAIGAVLRIAPVCPHGTRVSVCWGRG